MKKIVVVLGPHRSGTSLCTHAVQVLGATTGLEEVYASDENAKGFFEHERVILLNEALLNALGGSWDNPAFMGNAAIIAADLSGFRHDAITLFFDLFGDAECVVIKDPRICQLLPFWEEVFLACGFSQEQIFYIHTLRHPIEVALSQQSRVLKNPVFYEFGRNVEEGAALWLSLTAQSLLYTLGRNNFIVSYHGFLEAPENYLEKIAAYLSLKPDPDKVREFCSSFVDNNLYRSKIDNDAQSRVSQKLPQVLEIYDLLEPLCQEGNLTEENIKAVLDIFTSVKTQHTLLLCQVNAFSRLSTQNRNAKTMLEATREDLYASHEKMTQLEEKVSQFELRQKRSFYGRCQRIHAKLYNSLLSFPKVSLGMLPKVSECCRQLLGKLSHQPLNLWLYVRRKLVEFAINASSRHPGAVHSLRRIASPAVRFVDRLAFRFHSNRSMDTIDASNFATLYQQKGIFDDFEPLVTVIVPNYNHAPYLQERLESIYQQTYRNFEVILMDDCSKDESVTILESFQEKYSERTQIIVNEQNSGGVFHQWEKGINLAKGEILWIAESDDFCSENFLETLIPMFRNEAVMLAYTRTDFIRNREQQSFWSINENLHDIDPNRWRGAFVETAHDIVNEAFAIKNIIPNVSSAVFRKTDQLEILHDPKWKKMRTCGDWVLYLHLIRGGMLAYSPEATNYYRIHDKNTSVSSYAQDSFYQEHELVARTIRQYYDVPMATLAKQKHQLVTHWQQSRSDYSEDRFAECYSLERVETETSNRAPNLLMAGYAFCAGGGETFPILLANLMKARGYNVTFLDCNQVPRVEDIRRSLRSDIPVVSNLQKIRLIVERFNIDLIHSQHAWVDCSIAELVKERNTLPCRTIVTMHGMYEMMPANSAKYYLNLIRKHTAQIVYTAEKNLTAVREHGVYEPSITTRIDNALEVYDFTPLSRDSLGIMEDAFVLTLVSRAVPEKGWFEAVEAVNKARESSGKDIHLVLIGEGAAYDELRAKPLPAHIHLEGFRKNIREYFAASDIGFLPSRFKGESFPLVLIDSFHAGAPVLASAIGEIPYMVKTEEGEAGMLFDLKDDGSIDINDLAEKIAALATDNNFYDSLKRNVVHAAAKFDPEHLSCAYDTVYRRALAEA